MNRIAIAFSTKDRTELSKRSVEPLLQPDKFDLFWVDGSRTDEGRMFPWAVYDHLPLKQRYINSGVYGGSGAAIVYALWTLLRASNYIDPKLNHGWSSIPAYKYIGLCENDVLLAPDWLDRTMALFDQGAKDGLKVGAVSARCYEDRILIQRPGYAVMHNLGAGHIIFTREAAQLVLDTYRTQWTADNRKIFSLLSGIDIGSYWAFRGSEHFLVADWRWDAILAAHGYATLALTPSPVEMIGQPMELADMGLTLATGPVERVANPPTFERYRDNLKRINDGALKLPDQTYHHDQGGTTYFAHQIPALGGTYTGDWHLRDSIGYGPFAWQADLNADHPTASLTVPIFGPCEVLVSGGPHGGQVQVDDLMPTLPAESETGQLLSVVLQSNSYRPIVIKALSPGVSFYGIRTREPQPVNPQIKFNYSTLPRV